MVFVPNSRGNKAAANLRPTSAHALHAQDKFNHDYDDHSVFGFIIIVKGLKGKSSLLVIVATRTTISDDSPLIIKSFDQKFKFKT